ncbi:Spy/CpxP family protein refolding chaperone [Uliginosibacterium sp. 31-12]|uniref:Spy/CpxP family protein refolding chaperone n=1 Tax=Uliginosibacterium sp. 31-12 TaxID=3062781 RepID=UPI0026E27F13|nr:Spy/CpxP family protein refolding chaperone [Uliginosibacterium sp. 31-12]MDO6386227.1 Spy/CpxP family protein refolding chaperone [Uliginosibacterium sp. 31-12]
MSQHDQIIRRFLCVSALALALPFSAQAQEATQSAPAARPAPHGGMSHRGHHGMEQGHDFMGALRDLKLSSEQRDKLRALMQEQRTATQDKREALREARQALHKLVIDGNYTPERASAIASEIGKKNAELALAMAETGHKAQQILTPEQRKQLAERAQKPARR